MLTLSVISFLQVNDTCTVRMPNSFLVTVMSTDGDIIKTVQHSNTNVYVRLPQNMEDCNLIVRISAVNSAGISPPTNITVGKLLIPDGGILS